MFNEEKIVGVYDYSNGKITASSATLSSKERGRRGHLPINSKAGRFLKPRKMCKSVILETVGFQMSLFTSSSQEAHIFHSGSSDYLTE